MVVIGRFAGNYALCKVLPSIYQLKQYEYAINDHLSALLSILPLCEHNDRLSLLGLFELMAKSDASVSMAPANLFRIPVNLNPGRG